MKLFILSLFFVQITNTSLAFPVQRTLQKIRSLEREGKIPVAVLDLDETLIHSDKRKVASYIEALKKYNTTTLGTWPGQSRMAYEKLSYAGEAPMRSLQNQYDSVALFNQMGIEDLNFIHVLDSLMLPIYLSGEFIFLDSVNRGAVGLLAAIYKAHGKIYFVTSRFEAAQGVATLESLRKLNLYDNAGQSVLVMRQEGESSLEFKIRSFQEIRSSVVGREEVFMVSENEPENLNAMIDVFPGAMPVFVTGAIMHTDVPLNPMVPIVYTEDFTEK